LVVPGVVGQKQADAAKALAKVGLVPAPQPRYSDDAPAGQVISQSPAGGSDAQKGRKVTMVVSLGIPNVIFSLNGNIISGQIKNEKLAATPLAASEEIEDQPALAKDGRLLAYRRGPSPSTGQIWLMDTTDTRNARPLTSAGFDDRRPAFAPVNQVPPVLAFSSNRGANPKDTNLCFMTLDQPQPTPQCVEDPSQQLSRPAWAPDGRSIVAIVDDKDQNELALFTSNRPFSGNPSDWTRIGIVTDQMHGPAATDRVFSAAFSPDGTQLAITANWAGAPKVFLVPVQGGQIGQSPVPVPQITACELAWRPDGGELAVAARTGGADCNAKGQIIRVDPRAPSKQTVVTTGITNASDPVWALTAG
jgi:Tol biopolymer transport system component